jgi:hypothetical protein
MLQRHVQYYFINPTYFQCNTSVSKFSKIKKKKMSVLLIHLYTDIDENN